MLPENSSGTSFWAWFLLKNLFPFSLLMKKYLRKLVCLRNMHQGRTDRPICFWNRVEVIYHWEVQWKQMQYKNTMNRFCGLWLVFFFLASALPFQVPHVASLLSICLHTWMLVSFFLHRLSLFSVNFHFMLPEFSQLGTENKAEKMFTASHISLTKVSLASSGLLRGFCSIDPGNVC